MKKKHREIQKKVLEVITPNKNDKKRLFNTIDNLIYDVINEINKIDIDIKIELVGSTAKDTFLKNNLDIDLFLLFPINVDKEIISKHALKIGRKILKDTEECYAEHPYIRGKYCGYETEIVPSYQISHISQKLSAVDRTPLHTEFVKENLAEKQKDEVRLLKQFLKGNGCYGAEAEIMGFSGYLCEILILKYGSFIDLLSNATHWKKGIKLALDKNNSPYFDTPLTFIDPVDNQRNVASALSNDKFELFIKASLEYLRKPRITFFFPKEVKPWSKEKILKEIKKLPCEIIGLVFSKPDIISENLYPQIRKTSRSIIDLCDRYDFNICDTSFTIDLEKSLIYIFLMVEKKVINDNFEHIGPPVNLDGNVKEFKNKWACNPRVIKKPYIKNNRYFVELKREYKIINKLLSDNISDLSLGKQIQKDKDFKIIDNYKDLINNNLRVFWTKYLDDKKPWER